MCLLQRAMKSPNTFLLIGYKKLASPDQVLKCSRFTLGFDKEGAVTTLIDHKTKVKQAIFVSFNFVKHMKI